MIYECNLPYDQVCMYRKWELNRRNTNYSTSMKQSKTRLLYLVTGHNAHVITIWNLHLALCRFYCKNNV